MKNNSVEQGYQLVNVRDLMLGDYQKPLNTAWIKENAQKFDINRLGTILVSYRDGQYYIVDGQHRTMLAKRNGVSQLMAFVHVKLTYEEEAELFIATNTVRTRPTPLDVFNAKVEAKDKDAVEIKNIVESVGFIIKNGSAKNYISAITEVQKIYKKYGAFHLSQLLSITKETWNGEIYSLNNFMLRGLSEFIKIYEDNDNFDLKTFTNQLSKVDPKRAVAEAKADLTTDKTAVKMMNTLFKYYNKGLRNRKLENKHFVG